MPYVKPNAISTGQPADWDQIAENNSDGRRYINQQIIAADLAEESVDFPEIVKGELSVVGGVSHQFTTGNGYGNFIDGERAAYRWTAHTNTWKRENIKEITDQSNAQTIPSSQVVLSNVNHVADSFKTIRLEHRALVTYRCWLDVEVVESPIAEYGDKTVFPQHRFTTFMYLTQNGEATWGLTTKGRFFDETSFMSTGLTTSSWAGPKDQDPMRDQGTFDGHRILIKKEFYRRQYCMYKCIALEPGTYNFGVMIDSHHEKIYVKSQNVTVEVENCSENL